MLSPLNAEDKLLLKIVAGLSVILQVRCLQLFLVLWFDPVHVRIVD